MIAEQLAGDREHRAQPAATADRYGPELARTEEVDPRFCKKYNQTVGDVTLLTLRLRQRR
jgi:hypothetical protein